MFPSPHELLPHGKDFILVDGILQLEKGKSIITYKDVSEKDFWYKDHFPSNPIMPGVILIESMAQSCALLVLLSFEELKNKAFVLAGVKEARFKKPIIPPTRILIKSEFESRKMNIWFFKCKAFQGEEELAYTQIIAADIKK